MQLQLSLGHRTFANICRGNAVGFDVYRRTVGYTCGEEERITDQPIAWGGECDAPAELSFTDPGVLNPNTVYQYEARPVDAFRQPAQGDLAASVWGYGVVGTAVVAHGEPVLGDNFQVFVWVCPGECMPGGIVDVPGIDWAEYFGTTVTVLGQSASVVYYSNGWMPQFAGTSVSPSRCLVGVESVGWGAVKRLYD
jgi:hypothetical protein